MHAMPPPKPDVSSSLFISVSTLGHAVHVIGCRLSVLHILWTSQPRVPSVSTLGHAVHAALASHLLTYNVHDGPVCQVSQGQLATLAGLASGSLSSAPPPEASGDILALQDFR